MSGSVKNHLPPVELPNWKQPCEQCKADTPTKVVFMKAGLGNACAVCGRLRPFLPYISKAALAAAQNFRPMISIRTISDLCGNSAGRNLSAGKPCRRRHRPDRNPCRCVQVGFLRFGHWSMCEDTGDKKKPKKQDRSFWGKFTPKRNPKPPPPFQLYRGEHRGFTE